MATISELNIRLGLLTKDFDDGLRSVENKLRASGRRLSSLGSDLTIAISAPLAAFGAAAITAAGDVESLRLAMRATFEGAGRSIAEADKELEALRKSALAPGLDFEQAVRGSVRLQNVGFTAEKARGIIEQLANTLATTGGTAQDLDEVVNQFSQMIGKGKIFQDDLKIIVGRMPKLAQLMKDTFGTTTAEGLNALGVDARTFVDTMVAKMSELPRVSGGIKNSIVNAGSAVRNFLASIGEEINKAFDLGQKSDSFASTLGNLANWFKDLDDGTKRLIVEFGLFSVALGPAIKVIGVLKSTTAQGISLFRDMVGGLKNLATGVLNAAEAFKSLSLATQTFIVIGIATALYVAISAFSEYTRELSTAEKITNNIHEVNRQAAASIQDQKTAVELLTGVLKDNNATQDQRKKALDELKRISPQYFGNLDLEKSKVGDINSALQGYVQSLTRAATAQAAFDKLKSISGQVLDLDEAMKKGVGSGERWAAAMTTGNVQDILNRRNTALQTQKDALLQQRDALEKVIEANGGIASTVAAADGITNKFSNSTSKTKAELKAEAKAAKEAWKELDTLTETLLNMNEQSAKATVGEIKRTNQNFSPLPQATPALPGATGVPDPSRATQSFTALQLAITTTTDAYSVFGTTGQQVLANLALGTTTFNEAWTAMSENVVKSGDTMATVALALGQGLIDAFDGAGQGSESFARIFVKSATKIIGAAIRMAVAEAALSALQNTPYPYNLILAGIAGAAAQAIFQGLINKVVAPKLAGGGVLTKPTMFLGGEYPGASNGNPEIVAPQRLLTNIFRKEAGGGGVLEVTGILKGDDIHLSAQRAAAKQNRLK